MHLKKIWAVIYAVMLAAFSTFVLLDAFVIPKDRIKADEPIQSQEITDESIEAKAEAVITENSYKDDKISITISELREYDTSIYVADIQLAQIMKGQDCVTAYNLEVEVHQRCGLTVRLLISRHHMAVK